MTYREDFFTCQECAAIADATLGGVLYARRAKSSGSWRKLGGGPSRARMHRRYGQTCPTHVTRRGADVPNHSDAPADAGLTKVLSILIIALMLVAIGYTVWIVTRYWRHIGV